MVLLVTYALVAVAISFLCSVLEAVLLSVDDTWVEVACKAGRNGGKRMKSLRENIGRPLAAILTLNTIAHTIGAAGVGAQASHLFGDAALGITSAILTFLILVFSEIIPKTLGASYWRELASLSALILIWMIRLLYPLVRLSEWLTRWFGKDEQRKGLNRHEFSLMADLSHKSGLLASEEHRMLKKIMAIRELQIKDAMTPQTVIFSLDKQMTLQTFRDKHAHCPFSRIPLYEESRENITGFVLKGELLAQPVDAAATPLAHFEHTLPSMLKEMSLMQALKEMQRHHVHILLVVDEYGRVEGLITHEDVLETMLEMEFVDETDQTEDMQQKARALWRERAAQMGITDLEEFNKGEQTTPKS